MKRLVLLAFAVLGLAACQSDRLLDPALSASGGAALAARGWDGGSGLPAPDAHGLRVMAYNLYLGTNLGPLMQAQNEMEFLIAGVRAYGELQQTNFPARAGKIADQIAKVRPDVVAIEEAGLWSVSAPYAPGGPPLVPFVVQYDFIQLLLDSLEARGLAFTVPSVDSTSDVAAPVATAFDEFGNPTAFALVRFQDRDAVLVRDGVSFSDPQHGVYQTYLPLDLLGQETGIYNGWSSVRVTAKGGTFRFVATHLNAEYGPVNNGQALELAAVLQGETDPVVLAGDFNTGPGTAADFMQSYGILTGAGFTDLWLQERPQSAGLTNGPNDGVGALDAQGVLVPYPSLEFTTRVDLVLVKDAFGMPRAVHGALFGFQQGDRTPTGLWPSDHAAIAMVFELPAQLAGRQ